ncbi:MAG: Ig-like domain-containing protein, partial [Bryobacteraceae bacterium]
MDYSDTSPPALRLPVNSVAISAGGTSVRLNLNDTYSARATTFGANGEEVTDRSVTFITTNSRVISIQQTGVTAVLKAVGGGSAVVTAISEGKTSPPITFFVTAPCCQIGEGAPSAASQQLFQVAVSRSRLTVRLPASSQVRRIGTGLVQELQGADANSAARYLVTLGDKATAAYVVAGDILAKYDALGGPAQSLGYPLGDAVYDTAGVGRQLFQGGAIAGLPPRLVSGTVLQKWASMNYEAGAAGQPTGDVSSFLTFTGTSGMVQLFQKGALYGASSGPQSGKVYFVSGLIAAKYNNLGAGGGELGLPLGDEFSTGGKRHQDFEGGYLDYAPGDAEAILTLRDRKPSVTALPSIVAAGSRVRVTVAGFPNASSIRVSITGQTDFTVKAATGSYFWDIYVPTSTASGAVTVRAVDASNAANAASAVYTVRSSADIRAVIVKLRGDSQSAAPGAQAPQSLRVAVRDDGGNALAGVEVRFSATSGAQVAPGVAITDSQGQAETFLRMPLSEGIVLANAESVRQVVTFSARSTASTLTNYTKLTQSGDVPLGNGTATIAQSGSLLTAAASILRYYQNRGDLSMSNGVDLI